jgi:UDP-N-acetylmuramate--alanine ligase
MYGRIRHIHLVGIGGVGMSGIAEVLLNRGYTVSGSDLSDTEVTSRLRSLGVAVSVGHLAPNVEGADIVVTSSAIAPDNPELLEAQRRGIPLVRRAEMLAELMRTRYGVAIAGAHGKTTTTSLVGAVLASGGLDPTVVVGGRIRSYGHGARLGAGDFLVAEADESDASFLMLAPAIAVITNIDLEHVDHYGSLENIIGAFRDFAEKVPFYGVAIMCADDPLVMELASARKRRVITYGFSSHARLRVSAVACHAMTSRFHIEGIGEFSIDMPGRHNVLNATAAVAVGLELDVGVEAMRRALATFEGVGRRFNVTQTLRGITLVDDYGHHPTEVRAVLNAARDVWTGRRVLCVFQPHRYTRTHLLWRHFGPVFADADELWLLPVYSAGEREIPGVSSQLIYRAAREARHRRVTLLEESVEQVAARLLPELQNGDVVVTLGAGDVWKVNRDLTTALGMVDGDAT